MPEIQGIYAHHVLHGTGTFEEGPPPVEEMRARFERVVSHGWPYLVATDETGVLGFAYAAQLRDRAAYRYTAEDSVYVRPDCQGRGVGRALLTALLDAAAAAGFRQMLAVIGDAANSGSVGVHSALGFSHVGVWRAVGFKHGRWLDVVHMQRGLGGTDPPWSAPPVVPELDVTDLDASVRVYVEVFGFTCRFTRPEERFAYLVREGVHIMLEEVSGPGRRFDAMPPERPFGRGMNLQIEVADVDGLYDAVRRSGMAIRIPLEDRWYRQDQTEAGLRQFVVADPDGYLLRFASSLGRRPVGAVELQG